MQEESESESEVRTYEMRESVCPWSSNLGLCLYQDYFIGAKNKKET